MIERRYGIGVFRRFIFISTLKEDNKFCLLTYGSVLGAVFASMFPVRQWCLLKDFLFIIDSIGQYWTNGVRWCSWFWELLRYSVVQQFTPRGQNDAEFLSWVCRCRSRPLWFLGSLCRWYPSKFGEKDKKLVGSIPPSISNSSLLLNPFIASYFYPTPFKLLLQPLKPPLCLHPPVKPFCLHVGKLSTRGNLR